MSEDLTGRLVDADRAATPEGRAPRSMTQLPAVAAHPPGDSAPAGAYRPLHDPERADNWVPPLHMARTLARNTLAKHESANIHDDDAMLRAATGLEIVLRDLLNALDELDALVAPDAEEDGE